MIKMLTENEIKAEYLWEDVLRAFPDADELVEHPNGSLDSGIVEQVAEIVYKNGCFCQENQECFDLDGLLDRAECEDEERICHLAKEGKCNAFKLAKQLKEKVGNNGETKA
jgi:hypothetical protein